jgi:hypothetical protein
VGTDAACILQVFLSGYPILEAAKIKSKSQEVEGIVSHP